VPGKLHRHRALRGQAAIFVTMSLVPTMGVLGLVVDVGWSFYRKEATKTAAQAAANAAVTAGLNVPSYACTTGVPCQSATACPASPTSPPTDLIGTACLYAKQNGFVNSGRQAVTVEANNTGLPVAGVTNTQYWVRVTVSESIPQLFSAVLGNTWAQVKSESTDAIFMQANGSCVYALDRHAAGAITNVGNTNVNASCGMYDDSDNVAAMSISGTTDVTAGTIKIVGGYSTNGGAQVNPVPTTGAGLVPDPFGSVPQPNVPAGHGCDSNGVNGAFSPTMPADGFYVVCGDIRLTGNQAQTFPAGMYVVKNGGIVWNNGTVSGTGVTFFLTANPTSNYGGVSISGNVNVDLTAPTSGPDHGILFFQDRTIPTSGAASTFEGGATMKLKGSLYFSTTSISYTGGSSSAPVTTGLVARTVAFKGNSYFATDPNGAATGLGLPTIGMLE
jgi:hypothetical protein